MNYTYVTNPADLGGIANLVSSAPVIGLDVEATHLDPRKGRLRLVQLAVGDPNDPTIFVIDVFETKTLGPVIEALRETKGVIVIHNAKFEQKWFWWFYRLKLWPVFCTFRASALLHNGHDGLSHKLDNVIIRELKETPTNVGEGGSDWSGPLTQHQKDYAAEDVYRLLRLYPVLRAKLQEMGLLRAALIEFGVGLAEGRVELNGFRLDAQRWLALDAANVMAATRLQAELMDVLPHPLGQLGLPGIGASWNLRSPPQVKKSFARLGHNLPDTTEMTLAMLAGSVPAIAKFLEWRGFDQRIKTFGDDYLRHLDTDGRIHADYYAMLASGRYSCSDPNLQQIPHAPEYRDCFAVEDGRILILADYPGIEMRIVAEVSGDPALTQVFVSGQDAHYATAAILSDKPVSAVTKTERSFAKPVNFGLIYGMMPPKLVLYAQSGYGVSMSLKDAERYHRKYFENYAGVKRWHDRVMREGQRSGVSRTLSGRLRWLDPQTSWNEFKNTPIQGLGADALKMSLRIVQDNLDKAFGVSPPEHGDGPVALVHHVHDEIILEADNDPEMRTEAARILTSGMEEGIRTFLKNVPVEVEASFGTSWAEAK